jgi:type III restriction enzyme
MPSFALKTYQSRVLEALELFLRQSTTLGLEAAWAAAMQREFDDARRPAYRSAELGEVPCVCLRIPTGGGKTLMASHAIARIASALGLREYPVALWLVPSDAIRGQTLAALQTPGHAYRAALQETYGERFQVTDLESMHAIPADSYGRQAIVVVATIQSFRVTNKAGRRVYAMSEAWETHFRSLTLTPQQAQERGLACVTQGDLEEEGQAVLTARDIGRVKSSLANWLAWQQPIVIVDEAHNAKTSLSLAMLRDIRPSCVLDLTATPVPFKTNVLVSVSARELQAEDMIKLPIMLGEHETGWQDAVRDALLRRKQLEAEAMREPDYVRPIALFQAQDRGGEATVEVLKRHLIEEHHIPAAEVAVATGTQRELDGIDLADPRSAVRYVITVDALKEGWDCPFAYVLCSLQNLRSNQAVEQLLGRVLRMPYARKRASPALNKAYAHVIARSFSEAADALVDRLTSNMGFDPYSAAGALQPDTDDLTADFFGAAPATPATPPVLTLEIVLDGADPQQIQRALADHPDLKVQSYSRDGTTPTGALVTVRGEATDAQREAVVAAAPPDTRTDVLGRFVFHAARVQASRAPSERGERFADIPLLCVRIQGELELIERETLGELIAFDLLRADPRPELPGFALVEQTDLFEIYLDDERVRMKQADAAQLSLDSVPADATEDDLVRALETQVRRPGLTQVETLAYVQRVVAHLLRERDFTLTGLLRARFPLAQAIGRRIDSVVERSRKQGFQALMFGRAGAELAHDPTWIFRFEPNRYPVRHPYEGRWLFRKHFYPQISKLKTEGEEFECARELDKISEVKHWVRNLEQMPEFAFWLPTATDYFYPDFVAELEDGRLFVVEYKGEGYATNDDSREKRLVGERWAQTTGHRFAMIERVLNGKTVAEQLRNAIAS